MALTDVVAAQVLGEIDTLTRRIDKQVDHLSNIEPSLKKELDRISLITQEVAEKTRATANSVMLKTVHEAHLKLATAIEKTSIEVANSVAKKDASRWISIAATASFVTLTLVCFFAFDAGKSVGLQAGYAKSVDEKIAAAWANTEEGKEARKLASFGSIEHLAKCDRPGWLIEKREDGKLCSPQQYKDGLYGWRIE
jgi:hypothetical protein